MLKKFQRLKNKNKQNNFPITHVLYATKESLIITFELAR